MNSKILVNEHSVVTMHSDSPRVQRSQAMLRISSIDDSVGWTTKFL